MEERLMQRKHSLFTFLIVLIMILSACAPAATQTAVVTEAPVVEQPTEEPVVAPTEEPVVAPTEVPAADKKVVTFIWTQEFDTLNPLYTNMWFVTVLFPVYMCQAWWYDEANNPVPNLVTEIPSADNGGISEDGRTITLMLRDDIVWSDGTPITSADFKFTYDMELADGNAVSSRSPYDLIKTFT